MADKDLQEQTPAQKKEQAKRQKIAALRHRAAQGDEEAIAALHDAEATTAEHVGKVAGEKHKAKPPLTQGGRPVTAKVAADAADEVPGAADEDKGPTKGKGETASGPGTKTAAAKSRKRAGKKVASGKKAGKATT